MRLGGLRVIPERRFCSCCLQPTGACVSASVTLQSPSSNISWHLSASANLQDLCAFSGQSARGGKGRCHRDGSEQLEGHAGFPQQVAQQVFQRGAGPSAAEGDMLTCSAQHGCFPFMSVITSRGYFKLEHS